MRALLQYDIPHSHRSHDYEQKMKINLKAWVISALPYLAAFFRCIELITPTQCPLYWFSLHCWLPLAHTTLALFVWLMFNAWHVFPPSDSPFVGGFELEKLDHVVEDGKDDDDDHIPKTVTNTSLKSKLWAKPILEKLQPYKKEIHICAVRDPYNLQKHWIRKLWFWFRISMPHLFSF